MKYLSDAEVEEIDRNGRAYGWEVGRGAPIEETPLETSPDNPFIDPAWRNLIGQTTLTPPDSPDEDEEESASIQHARRELELAGNDADFNESIIGALKAFHAYGHSGGSASCAIPMLTDLLWQKNLTPLTDDPDDWMQVSPEQWPSPEAVYQSRRNSEAFSDDGGKTYYILSEIETDETTEERIKIMHESEKSGKVKVEEEK